jgi:hypothetical protein
MSTQYDAEFDLVMKRWFGGELSRGEVYDEVFEIIIKSGDRKFFDQAWEETREFIRERVDGYLESGTYRFFVKGSSALGPDMSWKMEKLLSIVPELRKSSE